MSDLIEVNSKKFGNFHYHKETMYLYWYFVCERQNVWHNRFVEKLPQQHWTDDPILSVYKFTNVYREIDRTTIWYHQNIAGYGDADRNDNSFPNGFDELDVVFATFIHRLFNRIETMQPLLPHLGVKEFNLKAITRVLEGLRKGSHGLPPQNIWTTAHLVTGVRYGGFDDKLYNILYLIELIHKDIDEIYNNIKESKSLEQLYEEIRKVQGFGPFLGYQYILDMINSKICNFSHDDFVVAGPGCKRGIRHVFPYDNEISFENAMMYMRINQHVFFKKYNLDFKFVEKFGGKDVGIHLGNIENCFCEFSKYYKTHRGTGRPRNKFTPTKKGFKL